MYDEKFSGFEMLHFMPLQVSLTLTSSFFILSLHFFFFKHLFFVRSILELNYLRVCYRFWFCMLFRAFGY
uniref:Uncharacterized protein n=1 Tax=Rhizophora mucronata TaxID=61149 RepID=A0A2P2MRK0_RHIMU